jgi:DNA-binding beta-propeller fold protein YncE
MTRRMSILVMGVILLVVAAIGGLAVRTTPTGPLLWTVALDQSPQNIVVDGQTRRAFITTFPIPVGVGSASMMTVLDTDTGAILRRLAIGGNGNPPPVVDERAGRVVVAASIKVRSGPGATGSVRVLDARSGALVRAVTVGLFPQGVAVDEQTGRAFVTGAGFAGAGPVGVLDTRTGRLLRTVNVGMEPHEQIVVDTRRERVFVPVYSQTGNGYVSVLDARSGRLLYTFAAGKASVAMAMDARTGRAFVVEGSSTGLCVLDARTGHLLRTVLAGLHPGIPVVDDQTGRAFVPTDAGISVLDTRSGAVLHTVALGQAQLAGPPLLDARRGRVFVVVTKVMRSRTWTRSLALGSGPAPVGPRPGSVIVLDAHSGAVVRTVALGDDSVPVVVDERAGRVVVLTRYWPGTSSSVSILDARTGALLHTRPVSVTVQGWAVDERTGRLLVINVAGFDFVPDSWAWLPAWLRRRLPFLPPPGRHSRPVPGGVTMIDPTR